MEREKIVLKSVKIGKGESLVLCKFGDEFVTWVHFEDTGAFYHGDYCQTVEEGLESFNYRMKERGVL